MIQEDKGDWLIKIGLLMLVIPLVFGVGIAIIVGIASINWTLGLLLSVFGVIWIIIALTLVVLGVIHKK